MPPSYFHPQISKCFGELGGKGEGREEGGGRGREGEGETSLPVVRPIPPFCVRKVQEMLRVKV